MIGAGGAGRGAVAMGTRGPRSPRRPREGPAAFAALPVPLAQLAKQERFPFPEDAFPFLRTARMRGSGAASPPPLSQRGMCPRLEQHRQPHGREGMGTGERPVNRAGT